MIKSREDLRFYLKADQIAMGVTESRPRIFGDEIWKYVRLLRKVEYTENSDSIIARLSRKILLIRWHRLGIRLGFEIPVNSIGPGLRIAHRGPIIINRTARIGENATIHPCVVIGVKYPLVDESPELGNNVLIGTGAKILGKIRIADGVIIGANAVVNKSFEEPNITIGGIPAVKIGNSGSQGLIVEATNLARKRVPIKNSRINARR